MRLLIYFVVLLIVFLSGFLVLINLLHRQEEFFLSDSNGAVINIWIDDFSRFDVLKDNKVKYLFVDIGGTNEDGTMATPKGYINRFVSFVNDYERIRKHDFVLLAYSEVGSYSVDIEDEVFRSNFVDSYNELIEDYGFDGVLVDIEPVRHEQRDSFLLLLEELRKGLSSKAIISVYPGHIIAYESDNEWEWSYDFYYSVSKRVDMISATSYDSSSSSEEEYKRYLREQIKLIASNEWEANFLFAIPTHKTYPETSDITFSVFEQEILNYPSNPFIGVVVFAEWTASEKDWKEMQKRIR